MAVWEAVSAINLADGVMSQSKNPIRRSIDTIVGKLLDYSGHILSIPKRRHQTCT
jgi:hypothetical protein